MFMSWPQVLSPLPLLLRQALEVVAGPPGVELQPGERRAAPGLVLQLEPAVTQQAHRWAVMLLELVQTSPSHRFANRFRQAFKDRRHRHNKGSVNPELESRAMAR